MLVKAKHDMANRIVVYKTVGSMTTNGSRTVAQIIQYSVFTVVKNVQLEVLHLVQKATMHSLKVSAIRKKHAKSLRSMKLQSD